MSKETDAGRGAVAAPVERPVRRPSLSEMLAALEAMSEGCCPCQEMQEDCINPCAARLALDARSEVAEVLGYGLAAAIKAQKPNEFAHVLTPGVLWDLYAR